MVAYFARLLSVFALGEHRASARPDFLPAPSVCSLGQQVLRGGSTVATYGYDANGNRETLTYSNGVTTTYQYNKANLVTALDNKKGASVLSSYAYTYYLDGNQAAKSDDTGRNTVYLYDGLGRLTQEAETGAPAGSLLKVYAYNTAGNRQTMTVSG